MQASTHSLSPLLLLLAWTAACDDRPGEVAGPPEHSEPVLGLIVLPDSAQTTRGSLLRLRAQVTQDGVPGAEAADAVWRSLTPDIATVDGSGLVTLVGAGEARVEAVTPEGADTARLLVREPMHLASVDAGTVVTCGVGKDGTAYCWGSVFSAGVGTFSPPNTSPCLHSVPCLTVPTPVAGPHLWDAVHAGAALVCGLATDATAHCWGDGIFGDGDEGRSATPRPVAGSQAWTALAVGGHACGLDASGVAWCWGENGRGQLGDGSVDTRRLPARVAADVTFTQIAVGEAFTCALDEVGRAFCWGDNRLGQLGRGAHDPSPHPSADSVAGGLRFSELSAAGAHVCGLARDGAAWCWGETAAPSGVPNCFVGYACVPAPARMGDALLVDLSAGHRHACGVTAGGGVVCWGSDYQGQLGRGEEHPGHMSADTVVGPVRFRSVSAGQSHTCGVSIEGAAYCWGLAIGGTGRGPSEAVRAAPHGVWPAP